MTQIRLASRKFRPLKIGIGGITGSGKSIGALKLAYGICGDWKKICAVDTENNSLDLYDHLGKFSVLPLEDKSPQGYMNAILMVENAGFEICIIDSLSHEWLSALDLADKTAKASRSGNSFAAWGEVTPLHNKFVSSWINTPMHIICTMRQKDEFVLEANEKGKMAPRRVGLKNIQREGVDFEFDILITIHGNHYCSTEKDRTQLLDGRPAFILDEKLGAELKEWSEKGPKEITLKDKVIELIKQIKDPALKDKIYNTVSKESSDEFMISAEKRILEILNTKE